MERSKNLWKAKPRALPLQRGGKRRVIVVDEQRLRGYIGSYWEGRCAPHDFAYELREGAGIRLPAPLTKIFSRYHAPKKPLQAL